MARLSDIIENFIKEMLSESSNDQVQIQRNELADQFRCAPSQINYVLTTRFTGEKGYVIESRRGGGGHIIIKQVTYDGTDRRNRLIYDGIGDNITYHNASSIIENLYDSKLITSREMDIMKMAVNDRTLQNSENKNTVRADILKNMLITVLS
ncbi:CtsR family transcriptional regulator [Clostridium sp. HCP1S3_B4]|uniref:CtsR family transcriptional regulator n=1 Tax=unclassified Clostridium TaxID=2614128 RepID=UPI0016B955DB|nr:CtsR family transcriptional regulator [Clostridium sp.]MDD5794630.1 CtsR family transcriptional regulator [Clostridiales bacterium]MDY2729382.1 CtsR family transcriptional regulator [Clostridium sp.]NLK22504.1 CtsR family transcriptional regulator [Clostridiales bacterium]